MSRGTRLRWALFGACAALVVGVLAWTSERVLSLEESQRESAREATHQARLRVALWRMDSALGPLLAQEAAAPWWGLRLESSPGPPVRSVDLDRRFPDERVRVRFALQAAAGGGKSAAKSDARSGFESFVAASPEDPADRWIVAELRTLGADGLRTRVHRDARAIHEWIAEAQVAAVQQPESAEPDDLSVQQGQASNYGDRQQRSRSARSGYQSFNGANSLLPDPQTEVAFPLTLEGVPDAEQPFVPVWLRSDAGRALAFAREPLPGLVQGFVLDWTRVRDFLLAEVADLYPGATLEPVVESAVAEDETGLVLATAPARLVLPEAPGGAAAGWTPTHTGLAVAWLAVLAALGASAYTLRAAVSDAERRARFASSVTHELRTPLTTFRLYSEMLADGMVRDETTRKEYLATLKAESARLASLVENVLAFARVEEGRAPRQRERLAVRDLVERVAPPLRRRADDAGVRLVIRVECDDAVEANVDAVGQILANLVDNACKYGAAPGLHAAPAAHGLQEAPAALGLHAAPAAHGLQEAPAAHGLQEAPAALGLQEAPAALGPHAAPAAHGLHAAPSALDLVVERRGGHVAFVVRDRGPGLARQDVAAAFTPFARGNRPPGDTVPGIGLGLALSRGLARDHGGDLVHETPAEGPGAEFVLTLPVGQG